MNFSKLTVKEYFSFPYSEYVTDVLKALPIPETIRIKKNKYDVYPDLDQKTFGQKCLLDQLVYTSDYDLIKKLLAIIYFIDVFGCKFDDDRINECELLIDNCLITEAYPVALHYLDWLNKANENEKRLSSKPDPKWIAAGAEELSKFGVVGVVIGLARSLHCSHKKIYNYPYIFVFSILLYEKIERDVNKRYFEILNPKKK